MYLNLMAVFKIQPSAKADCNDYVFFIAVRFSERTIFIGFTVFLTIPDNELCNRLTIIEY